MLLWNRSHNKSEKNLQRLKQSEDSLRIIKAQRDTYLIEIYSLTKVITILDSQRVEIKTQNVIKKNNIRRLPADSVDSFIRAIIRN